MVCLYMSFKPRLPHGLYYRWTTDSSGSYPCIYQKSISLFPLRILIVVENIGVRRTELAKSYSFKDDNVIGPYVSSGCGLKSYRQQRSKEKRTGNALGWEKLIKSHCRVLDTLSVLCSPFSSCLWILHHPFPSNIGYIYIINQ